MKNPSTSDDTREIRKMGETSENCAGKHHLRRQECEQCNLFNEMQCPLPQEPQKEVKSKRHWVDLIKVTERFQ